MYRVITKHTRPSTSVEFFNPKTSTLVSDETKLYIRDNFILTGKIIHSEESLSEDGLEMTIMVIYPDEASFNEWKDDAIIDEKIYQVASEYSKENGITSGIVVKEEI
jgi:hypothetical protein